MSYYIIGSNHELADTTFSSKISFDEYKKNLLIQQLVGNQLADSALILSTCNRSEVYVFCADVLDKSEWTTQINQLILDIHGLDSSALNQFYTKLNHDACLHLFKVTCGLDSLVLGESQITSQLKEAFNFTKDFHARTNTKVPNEIYNLISTCFSCAKEVRTKTSIGKFAVSIAYLACKIARETISDFSNQKILLIGASQTNLLLARHLIRNGINDLYIANRSLSNANKFVEEIGCGSAFELKDLPYLIEKCNLIFSSTSSNEFILKSSDFNKLNTNNLSKIFFDLAIPNDIDPQIGDISNVKLYNRDHLQLMIKSNRQKRIEAIDETFPIIKKHLNDFIVQNRIIQGNEIIVEYRNSIHQQREKMLTSAKNAILRGEDPIAVIENFSIGLTNKILHTPTLILTSMIKGGKLCTLRKLHNYLDRNTKNSIQIVIEDALNKDVFKNSACCVTGNQISNSSNTEPCFDVIPNDCKCFRSKNCCNVSDMKELCSLSDTNFEENRFDQELKFKEKNTNNEKIKINCNQNKANFHIENQTDEDMDIFTIENLKGIFVPFNFNSKLDNTFLQSDLTNDLNYLDQNMRIIHLTENAYIEEPLNYHTYGLGYVKFIEKKK